MMTLQERIIWDEYWSYVKSFIDATSMSSLADEKELQEAFCKYMEKKYKSTKRELKIPALEKIGDLGEENWIIDEATKYSDQNYILCELKFHGKNQDPRDFAKEVNDDSKELVDIVRHYSDVQVGMSLFVTIDYKDFEECDAMGNVFKYYKDNSDGEKGIVYFRVAVFTKSNQGGQKNINSKYKSNVSIYFSEES